MSYTPLNQEERQSVKERALSGFSDLLGKPKRDDVRKELYNPYALNVLQKLSLLLILVVAVVTGYKMTSIAIPFAYSFFDYRNIFIDLFAGGMALSFILMATSGLIYFKLMDDDPMVEQLKRKHSYIKWTGGWQVSTVSASIAFLFFYYVVGYTLEVSAALAGFSWVVFIYKGGFPSNILQWTAPRLFNFLVIVIFLWLAQVSTYGMGTVFEQFVIVFVELALALVVSQVLTQMRQWDALVNEHYTARRKSYDEAMTNYSTDSRYLAILYRELHEAIVYLRRRSSNKMVSPNIHLEGKDEVAEYVMREYERMTAGSSFATQVLARSKVVATPEQEVATKELLPTNEDGKYLPPHGDEYWTADALRNHFASRGLDPKGKYTESDLALDYAAGTKARTAWREGAKTYFVLYQ